jgi:hypothetical protein
LREQGVKLRALAGAGFLADAFILEPVIDLKTSLLDFGILLVQVTVFFIDAAVGENSHDVLVVSNYSSRLDGVKCGKFFGG